MILVEIFDDIIDNLRDTGTITNVSEAAGISTMTSVNSLEADEVITIDSIDYIILTASSPKFTVTGTGITATTWKAKAPYYDYGHPREIFNTLSEKTKNDTFKYQKYPLIFLWLDIEEDVNDYRTIEEDIMIVIITSTEQNYKALNRTDNIFIPILHPLYDDLIKYIKRSMYVTSNEESDNKYHHKKKDRYYWGTEDDFGNMGNIGNDYLDAVVISGLNLELIKCKTR